MPAHKHCELFLPALRVGCKRACSKRRGFSPGVAAHLSQSATVHTDYKIKKVLVATGGGMSLVCRDIATPCFFNCYFLSATARDSLFGPARLIGCQWLIRHHPLRPVIKLGVHHTRKKERKRCLGSSRGVISISFEFHVSWSS